MRLRINDSGVKFSDWVHENRLRRRLSQAALADAAELGEATISLIERGERDDAPPTPLTIEKLQNAFGVAFPALVPRHYDMQMTGSRRIGDASSIEPQRVPINELGNQTNSALGERPPPGEAIDDIPLLADVRGGLPDGGVYDGTVEAQLPVRRMYGIEDPQAFALRVVGDSMAPRIPEGAIVIVAPNDERLDGDTCFVQFGGEHDYMATIKNVFDAGEDWLLIAGNPNFEPQSERVPKAHVQRVLPVVWYAVPTR